MRKILLPLLLALVSFGGHSQSTSSKNPENQVVPAKSDPRDEMRALNRYIMSIEKKMEVVAADPDQKREAEKSGWFKEMRGYIKDSRKRLKELRSELKKQDNAK